MHVVERRRLEPLVLEAEHDLDRRAHRQIEFRGGGLFEERVLGSTYIDRQKPIRLRFLDVLDRLRELRDAERDEFLTDDLAAEILHDLPVPFRRDLTEIVVGGDDVDLLSELLLHPGDQSRELLLGDRPHADHAGVAHAALILVGIEVRSGRSIDDRSDGLARRRGDAADQHVDLVATEQTSRELLISGVVALRIEMDKLDLPSENAAALIDFLDRQLRPVEFRYAHERKIAGDILEQTDFQRRFGRLNGTDRGRSERDAKKRSSKQT